MKNKSKIKQTNLILMAATDILGVVFAFTLGFLIRGSFSFAELSGYFKYVLLGIPLLIIIFCLSFSFFGVYKIMWQYAGFMDLLKLILLTVADYGFFSFFHYFLICKKEYPRSAYLIGFFICVITVIVIRAIPFITEKRNLKKRSKNSGFIKGNIMIIGAGSAASLLILDIINNSKIDSSLLKCLIDDDPTKKNSSISGIRVYGGRDKIPEAVERFNIENIFFAIPSCSSKARSEILSICAGTSCRVMMVPYIDEIVSEKSLTTEIRAVKIEDLLGREPVKLDMSIAGGLITGKIVLVTGGGGSIGSELCRQIAKLKPEQLIIFDVYENNAYAIQNELKYKYPSLNLETLIGSVRDTDRVDSVFETYKPQIVFHAAAHKHVPLMEESPNEAIKNNVFGTYNTAKAAKKYGSEKFVLISTDKAVNPTNVMGASKRLCEMIVQSMNDGGGTDFAAVRFGNVLGSNGSVIPLFKEQVEHGGPVTVTHPDIIRYFMTIPEAVSLVLTAGSAAHGGEIFVLEMGNPVKILTLAENLIRLSGKTPGRDIKIEFTGLRPGEKLFEELCMSEEGVFKTDNKLIHIAKPIYFDKDKLKEQLGKLHEIMSDDTVDIRAAIKEVVSTYNPADNG